MATQQSRSATINRDTNETKIRVALNLDGGELPQLENAEGAEVNGQLKSHATQSSQSQQIDIDTGIGFLDHMLHALAKHSGWSLYIRTRGDLHSTSLPSPIPTSPLTHLTQSTTTTPPKTPSSLSAPPSKPRCTPPPASHASATPTHPSTKRSRAPCSTSPTDRSPSSSSGYGARRSAT